jgi:formate/nitrite transporter FocA (FNT family)
MQPYPTSGSVVEQRQGAPSSVLNAVKLMYLGAAISTVSFIVSLVTIGGTKAAVRKAFPHYTAHQVNQEAKFIVILAVVAGVLGIALWLWMARKTGQGKGWARILSSVLFVFSTLDMIGVFSGPKTFTIIFPVLTWLVGLGAIVLLWQSSSSSYFRPPQYL